MHRRSKTLLVIATVLGALLPIAAMAQSPLTENTLRLHDKSQRVQASLQSLAWMAGSWIGTGLGGEVEESWAPPSAGSMTGTFKLVQEGEPVFYEFFVIVEEEGSLALKLKHFDPDMKGWEEKDDFVTFRLVKLGERAAYFSGLTYRAVGEDRLQVFLALHRGDEVNEMAFEFQRR
jgi:hypothetical protein